MARIMYKHWVYFKGVSHTVGCCMTTVKVIVKDEDVYLSLVNGQGHYFQLTEHYISIINFKEFNLYKYMALYMPTICSRSLK